MILHRLRTMPPSRRLTQPERQRAKVIAGLLCAKPRVLHTLCQGWTRRRVSKRLTDEQRAENRKGVCRRRLADNRTGGVAMKTLPTGIDRSREASLDLQRIQEMRRWVNICGKAADLWLQKRGHVTSNHRWGVYTLTTQHPSRGRIRV